MNTARISPGATGWITARGSRVRAWAMRLNNGTFVTVSGRVIPDENLTSYEPDTRNKVSRRGRW